MNVLAWLAIAIPVIALLAWISWSLTRQSENQLSSLRQEVQTSLATQNQAITSPSIT